MKRTWWSFLAVLMSYVSKYASAIMLWSFRHSERYGQRAGLLPIKQDIPRVDPWQKFYGLPDDN